MKLAVRFLFLRACEDCVDNFFCFFFFSFFSSPVFLYLGCNSSWPGTAHGSGSSKFSQASRELVNDTLQNYLKSLNAMARTIVLETETVEKEHNCDWKKIDAARKEDIVNKHFVPCEVRQRYGAQRASSSCSVTSPGPLHQVSSHQDNLEVENRLSRLQERQGRRTPCRSKELFYSNDLSSTVSDS